MREQKNAENPVKTREEGRGKRGLWRAGGKGQQKRPVNV